MSNEPKHTATPWELNPTTDGVSITSKVGVIVFCYDVSIPDYDKKIPKANAARIVQCVNACEGLSNEDLEVKVQIQLSNLAYKVDRNAQERDKAESELESLRAENAELIEALMGIVEANESEDLDLIQTVYLMTGIASTTLAKYEKP